MVAFIFYVISFVLAFIGLVIGSYTDIKTREVPDLLNFGLLITGFSLSLVAALVFWDTSYITSSILGFALCFLLSCAMFYTGQWGGGDAKMLMALGALLGLPLSSLLSILSSPFTYLTSPFSLPVLLLFLFLIFFMGGIYGTVWLLLLLIVHRHEFFARFLVLLVEQKKNVFLIHFFSFFSLLSFFYFSELSLRLLALLLFFMIPFLFYSFVIIKILEKIAFVKEIPVAALTEGDWVAEDIIVADKVIVRKKDLGVSKEQLQELQALAKKEKIKTIFVKYGIPFVPSFLIAFVATISLVYLL